MDCVCLEPRVSVVGGTGYCNTPRENLVLSPVVPIFFQGLALSLFSPVKRGRDVQVKSPSTHTQTYTFIFATKLDSQSVKLNLDDFICTTKYKLEELNLIWETGSSTLFHLISGFEMMSILEALATKTPPQGTLP